MEDRWVGDGGQVGDEIEDRWVGDGGQVGGRWRTGGWEDGGQVGDEIEDRWLMRWRTGG